MKAAPPAIASPILCLDGSADVAKSFSSSHIDFGPASRIFDVEESPAHFMPRERSSGSWARENSEQETDEEEDCQIPRNHETK
jgi:hypothetical protein